MCQRVSHLQISLEIKVAGANFLVLSSQNSQTLVGVSVKTLSSFPANMPWPSAPLDRLLLLEWEITPTHEHVHSSCSWTSKWLHREQALPFAVQEAVRVQ